MERKDYKQNGDGPDLKAINIILHYSELNHPDCLGKKAIFLNYMSLIRRHERGKWQTSLWNTSTHQRAHNELDPTEMASDLLPEQNRLHPSSQENPSNV